MAFGCRSCSVQAKEGVGRELATWEAVLQGIAEKKSLVFPSEMLWVNLLAVRLLKTLT